MKTSSQPRCMSPKRRGVAALAVLGLAVLSPGATKADFHALQGDQLSPPRESINFPSDVVQSIAWSSQINATTGPLGTPSNPPPYGDVYFNGYDGRTSSSNALLLHTPNGGSFLEPVDQTTPPYTHPDMYTLTISGAALTDSSNNSLALTGIDFQLDYNNNKNPGTVTFNVFGSGQTIANTPLFTDTFNITVAGQDHFVIYATNNESFTTVQIQTSDSAPIIDLKHPEITTTPNPNVQPVPEPASLTLSAIGSVIGIAAAWRRRKRNATEGKRII